MIEIGLEQLLRERYCGNRVGNSLYCIDTYIIGLERFKEKVVETKLGIKGGTKKKENVVEKELGKKGGSEVEVKIRG